MLSGSKGAYVLDSNDTKGRWPDLLAGIEKWIHKKWLQGDLSTKTPNSPICVETESAAELRTSDRKRGRKAGRSNVMSRHARV